MNKPFRLRPLTIIIQGDGTCAFRVQAVVTIEVDGKQKTAAAEGSAPASALERAMREALTVLYERDFRPVDIPCEGSWHDLQTVCSILVRGFAEQITGGKSA